ncbi:MAG: type IV toxin-antitoxin system AbiEi family antitoxin domain-containing protein [Lachnospiraceae bacterium]|nr:type IV toxin-antitoxin system AbiEi family antitoxin domain-containing protein [Lachnospiraceae bacterium]
MIACATLEKTEEDVVMTIAFSTDKRYYTAADLSSMGLSYYRINRLIDEGKLVKLANKVYENTSYVGDESDFAVVAAYAPKSILCMMTAARFYGLTTFLPDTVDVAIERSMKISKLPEWPNITVWYFPETRYKTGIRTVTDETGTYRMYDVEKTVVDILYHRNKVGIEETKEVLVQYLRREDRDLVRLRRYAEELGCGKILQTYLEVLL